MACSQDANGPRPWVIGDFVRRTRIIVGDESISPYRKGIKDLAYNANTLMARCRKPFVTDGQDSTAALTLTTSFQTFGWYVIRTQNYSGRTTVRFQIRVGTTTGGTYEVKASLIPVSGSTVTNTASSSATGWIGWSVTGAALNTVYIVKLEARYTSAGGSWNPQAVYIDQLSETNNIITTNMSWVLEGVHPLDVNQYSTDGALSVIMARELVHNNNVLFANQVNHVITSASWHIHTTGTTSTVANGLQTYYGTTTYGSWSTTGSAGLIKEWLYWPRPGVTSLKVYINGFVAAWASGTDTANFRLKIVGQNASQISFSIAAATANYAVGSWTVFGTSMPISPDAGGPLKIQLYGGHGSNGRIAYIQTLNLIEDAPLTPAYG